MNEHGLEMWALFMHLAEAVGTIPREALFALLRRFGLSDHYVKAMMRLHHRQKNRPANQDL
jgi:hypothetical protein